MRVAGLAINVQIKRKRMRSEGEETDEGNALSSRRIKEMGSGAVKLLFSF